MLLEVKSWPDSCIMPHSTHGIMGRRFPDGELLRYRKLVPQQLGDVIVVTNFHEISADQSPGVVICMKTYLASVFPLFHESEATCKLWVRVTLVHSLGTVTAGLGSWGAEGAVHSSVFLIWPLLGIYIWTSSSEPNKIYTFGELFIIHINIHCTLSR